VLLAAVEKKRPKDESLAREWSKSLIALVSLERLMGDEAEARKLFFRCDASCARHIGSLEWNNIRSWACEPISEQKKEICRSKKRKP
jgi:hypothetical protein